MASECVLPECILSFRELHARAAVTGPISATAGGVALLDDVTGYVRKGGVTAVMGQGSSGKSLLLRLLAGRERLLSCSGSVQCAGRSVLLGSSSSCIGLVGQDDELLIGELTAREVIAFHGQLGSAARRSQLEVDALIDSVIAALQLDAVKGNIVGTVLRRGLSGGEKRRTSVGAVLASRPAVLCLDEATSGLDAAVAYSVIQAIKALAVHDGIGVLLTIHQPSARILTLCDDLILLDGGREVYVGPMALAVQHFDSLGFPCPPQTTSTDHFLDVIQSVKGSSQVLFDGYKRCVLKQSIITQLRQQQLAAATASGSNRILPPLWKQYYVIAIRNLQVAMRDLSLYHFQLVMAAGFAFMTGAVFWKLPTTIGYRMSDVANGLTWLTFIASYLQVFKVYHLFTNKLRVKDEASNGLYAYHAWSVANLLTSALFMFVCYVPTLLIGYAMMGLPNAAIGYFIITIFLTALTAEALMDVICMCTDSLPTAILIGQGALVILCVYGGGAFIKWSSLGFWVWLSDLSLYTFSSRGLMIATFKQLHYQCEAEDVDTASTSPFCSSNGVTYQCDAGGVHSDGGCTVAGLTVLQQYYDVNETSQWQQFGYLFVLFVGFRLLAHLFLVYPPKQLLYQSYRAIARSVTSTSSLLQPVSMSRPPLTGPVTQLTSKRTSPFAAVSAAGQTTVNMRTEVEAGAVLRFTDVSLILRSKQHSMLIQGVTGEAHAGRVLAIMGPSGGGEAHMHLISITLAPDCTRVPNDSFTKRLTERSTLSRVLCL